MRIRAPKKNAIDEQSKPPVSLRHDHTQEPAGLFGWFRRRKKAEERLKAFSGGTIEFAHNGFYRGPHHRHWLRHTCGCLFLASEAEVAKLGESACAFCGVSNVEDLSRFGSVEAVQELVAIMTGQNLEFCSTNRLGKADESYSFFCHIHQSKVHSTFSTFAERPDEVCVDCFFDALKRRSIAGGV